MNNIFLELKREEISYGLKGTSNKFTILMQLTLLVNAI